MLVKYINLMKTKILFFLLLFTVVSFIFSNATFAQVENVPLSNPVYNYLKEMSVKKIISGLNDDNPNLSRFQVADFINTIQSKSNELSTAEKKLLNKYMNEFVPEEINKKTTASLIAGNMDVSNGFKYILTDKQKYLFSYEKNENNIFIEPLFNLYYSHGFKPKSNANAVLFDGGFRVRGTIFNHLGYNFSLVKGGADGDSVLIESTFPPIKSTYKYVENIENITNYEFTNGYLKYYFEPSEGMGISAQLGREQIKYGLGYSDRLALSGNAPNMDFLKFNFQYGIINFSSIYATTVGDFNLDRELRYTKSFTANRIKFAIKNLFDLGIGETIISSEGIQLGYLNPLMFYKFVEMSLQDRDNGTVFFDAQTHFIKDLEFQGTFFLDENILSNLSDLEKASNKTAYQLGFFMYEPAGLKNLSLIFEYTKIRPYVYTHFDPKNKYTAFDVNMGHPIGPNADQIFLKMNYNLNEKVSFGMEYQKIRKGENVYNEKGELVRNVGGDINQSFRGGIDADEAYFLDGIRINSQIFKFNLRYEPLKNYVFDLNYVYNSSKNTTYNKFQDFSYGYLKFYFDY